MRGSACKGAIGVRTVTSYNNGGVIANGFDSVAIRVCNAGNPLAPSREHDGPLESAFECGGRQNTGGGGRRIERLAGCRSDGEHNVAVECGAAPVSYTHLRAHETPEHLVCR